MTQRKRLKTPDQVRAEFNRKGLTVVSWARANRANPNLVYDILRGAPHRRCLRGQSHRIAVLLGLKEGEIAEAA